MTRMTQWFGRTVTVAAATALLMGCGDEAPLASELNGTSVAKVTLASATMSENTGIATLRRATARYHNIDKAMADGYTLLAECEDRPGHGTAGALYVNFDHLLDGVIDLERPDGLLYDPSANGKLKLVGVDLAVPYALWADAAPPEFAGVSFQPEDEFGAWALHIWIWRHNPEGMFAEGHPGVTC